MFRSRRPSHWARRAPLIALLGGALWSSGCDLARHPAGPGTIAFSATQDFGHHPGLRGVAPRLSAATTVQGLQSRGGPPLTFGRSNALTQVGPVSVTKGQRWYQYVDGVQSDGRAADAGLQAGYRIWWDLHSLAAPGLPAAVIGSYPEPFVHGVAGKRLPVVLICAPDVAEACTTVSRALAREGVPVALQGIGTGSGQASLAIVVGVFGELTGQIDAALLEKGPSASGVYARFAGSSYGTLQLLDGRGSAVRSLGAGAGLIAATRDKVSEPTWLITGTDVGGVGAAARALTPQRLHDHFALAVTGAGDLPVPLP